jgi:hypothetical protein
LPNSSTAPRSIAKLNARRPNATAIAAAEAWVLAEKDGRVQKQGGPRQKAQNGLIAHPREHFFFSVRFTIIVNSTSDLCLKGISLGPMTAMQAQRIGALPGLPLLHEVVTRHVTQHAAKLLRGLTVFACALGSAA